MVYKPLRVCVSPNFLIKVPGVFRHRVSADEVRNQDGVPLERLQNKILLSGNLKIPVVFYFYP